MIGTRYCPTCGRATVHKVHNNISAECVHCHLIRTPEEVARDTLTAKKLGIKILQISDVEKSSS